jgi:type IV secretory pathway TrbD component
MNHKINPTFRSLNHPLLLLGVERKLFFVLVTTSFALFNLSGALVPALVLFSVALTGARLAERKDRQYFRILMNSQRWRVRYDPARRSRAQGE